MISHVIELRTSLSKEKLLTYITKFLSTHSFKSRYLIIKINLHSDNNIIVPIGGIYFIDLKNASEVKSFKFYIKQYYVYNYLTQTDIPEIRGIVFNYTEITKKEYTEHTSNFVKDLEN